ncbi:MAG: aminoacyl-tRNA hydrolase [Flavobacteriaceae bacterium]|nr:MAG: aminoacyl-tRNA hydrolase [Flavobacteriaceae bacterium]
MNKYLIVGLGNIGPEYVYTRHNIGFLIADELASSQGLTFSPTSFGVKIQFKYKGRSVMVLKPDTYMNLSGKAIKYHLGKENIPLENLLVITDDLNLEFGTFRLKAKGSDGGHNGLKSVQSLLNTTLYPRFRFGVGDSFQKGKQVDYVLGKWTEQEMQTLADRIEKAKDAALSFVFAGLSNTMNQFNGKE